MAVLLKTCINSSKIDKKRKQKRGLRRIFLVNLFQNKAFNIVYKKLVLNDKFFLLSNEFN
ncbi:MAG: hypothetical protein COW67_13515 [Flavobacteriales bacterium CG18_big_fil_WC_8_21_14_2_50_32_9]|nr:MAG: hypothetical protein COW67_13515 [Flavobacteriales bacterium CG18_big_fil_WC_8_21_14_2_50_32_9]